MNLYQTCEFEDYRSYRNVIMSNYVKEKGV